MGPGVYSRRGLRTMSGTLRGTRVIYNSCLLILRRCTGPNSFVFLSPPCLPVSRCSSFGQCAGRRFCRRSRIRLTGVIVQLRRVNYSIMLAGSGRPLIRRLCSPFGVSIVRAGHRVSYGKGDEGNRSIVIAIPPGRGALVGLTPRPLPRRMSYCPPAHFVKSGDGLLSRV